MHSPRGLFLLLLLNRAQSSLLFLRWLLFARTALIRVYILLFLLSQFHLSFASTHWGRRGLLVWHCWAIPAACHHPVGLFLAKFVFANDSLSDCFT